MASAPAEGVEGTVELRRHAPFLAAEVTVEAPTRRAASSAGFRPLASYIFGANDPGSAIAMTAPVATAPVTPDTAGGMEGGDGARIAMTAPVTTAGTGGEWTVRFSMPQGWTMDTLPAPADPRVRLVEVPAHLRLALRFTGAPDPGRVAAAERALDAFAAREGLEPDGPPILAGYDGPSVPEAEKRWEVQRAVTRPD